VYFLVRFFAEILYLKTVYENMGVGGKDCFTWNTAPICFWGLIVCVKSGISLRFKERGAVKRGPGSAKRPPPPRTVADSPHPLPHTPRGIRWPWLPGSGSRGSGLCPSDHGPRTTDHGGPAMVHGMATGRPGCLPDIMPGRTTAPRRRFCSGRGRRAKKSPGIARADRGAGA